MGRRKYWSNAERQRVYRERKARFRELDRSAGKVIEALQKSRTPRKVVVEVVRSDWWGLRVRLQCGHVVVASPRFNRVAGVLLPPRTCLCRECEKLN